MMKIKPIILENYKDKTYPINYDILTKPLFHGTRTYTLTCSNEERENFLKASGLVIRYVNNLLEKIPTDIIDDYRRKTLIDGIHSLMGQSMYDGGISNYQYGDFYVTTSLWSAIHYSNNAGGELGQYAYHYVRGINDLNLRIDDESISEACAIILKEYPFFNNSEHIILMTQDIDYKDLAYEAGEPLINEKHPLGFKHTVKRIYDTCEEDNFTSQEAFRLENPEKYPFYSIKEEDFKKAFSYFTDIKDVDKLIREAKYYSNCNMDYLIK